MKSLLNKLVLLIITCALTVGAAILIPTVRSEPITRHDIYLALIIGVVLWIFYMFTGRLKDWPFKNQQ
jgi:putative flippase GtrA